MSRDPIKEYNLLIKYIFYSVLFLVLGRFFFWPLFNWYGGLNSSTCLVYHSYMWLRFAVQIYSVMSYIHCCKLMHDKYINKVAEDLVLSFIIWSFVFTYVLTFEVFGVFSNDPLLALDRIAVIRAADRSLNFFFFFLCICLSFRQEQVFKNSLSYFDKKIYLLGYLVGFNILSFVFEFSKYFIFDTENSLGFFSLYRVLAASPQFN